MLFQWVISRRIESPQKPQNHSKENYLCFWNANSRAKVGSFKPAVIAFVNKANQITIRRHLRDGCSECILTFPLRTDPVWRLVLVTSTVATKWDRELSTFILVQATLLFLRARTKQFISCAEFETSSTVAPGTWVYPLESFLTSSFSWNIEKGGDEDIDSSVNIPRT